MKILELMSIFSIEGPLHFQKKCNLQRLLHTWVSPQQYKVFMKFTRHYGHIDNTSPKKYQLDILGIVFKQID